MTPRFQLGAAALVLALACADSPIQPAEDAILSHKPNHGGGGAPADSTASIVLDNFGGGMSVATAPIVDGQDYADAKINSGGQLWTYSYDGNPKRGDPVTHRVCFDLTDTVAVYDPAELDAFTALVGGDVTTSCAWGLLHSRDHSNGDARMFQAVGAIEHSGGKFVFKEFDTKNGSWEWRIIFDSYPFQTPPPVDEGKGLCIHRVDADNWTLFNGCVADNGAVIDDVVELWRMSFTSGEVTHVASFTVPLSFTVQRQ